MFDNVSKNSLRKESFSRILQTSFNCCNKLSLIVYAILFVLVVWVLAAFGKCIFSRLFFCSDKLLGLALVCGFRHSKGMQTLLSTTGLGNSAPKIRLSMLYNHAKSKMHLSACLKATGRNGDDVDLSGSPSQEHFLDVLKAVREGKSAGNNGIPHIGKRWKIRNMKFCLAEAKRSLIRSSLRDAKVIALHQDCRAAKLAVRYVSVDSKLQVSRGVLGCLDLTKFNGSDALGLRDATLKIIYDASVPFHHAPSGKVKRRLEEHVFDNIVATIELFDADAASDETLAGRLLRGIRPGSDEESAFTSAFPNLKVCNRDKPHGARRTVRWK